MSLSSVLRSIHRDGLPELPDLLTRICEVGVLPSAWVVVLERNE